MRAFAKLESLKERPHAIMTTNDLVACGIISAARSKGWKVPGDLAVVGFEADESQVADAMGLTNITNPLQRIGQEMFRTLYQQLNGQPLEPASLAFELKVRQSTC
ncbi:Catabolite control protein A [compost metagenome]|jgi:DNA-binding LacI/PurR family transcriptional regulator